MDTIESKHFRCLVLMCTYNGEKYLKEQIDSILNQKGVDVFIKVADDCSTDSTEQILKSYKERFKNFDYSVNKANKNFSYNFIDLLFSVKDSEFDFYAFSDQDDYWHEDKLLQAINKINQTESKNDKGILYISNQNAVDADLKFIKKTYIDSPVENNSYVYLCENIATGCTFVFDCKFKNHFCSYYPKNIFLHDHYMFLVAVFTADYVYDDSAHIDYRQHSNNLIGVKRKNTLKEKFKRFIKNKKSMSLITTEVLTGFDEFITERDKKFIGLVSNYHKNFVKKLRFLMCLKVHPKTHFINYKIKVLFGKF